LFHRIRYYFDNLDGIGEALELNHPAVRILESLQLASDVDDCVTG
jgi:hypothetical protein